MIISYKIEQKKILWFLTNRIRDIEGGLDTTACPILFDALQTVIVLFNFWLMIVLRFIVYPIGGPRGVIWLLVYVIIVYYV